MPNYQVGPYVNIGNMSTQSQLLFLLVPNLASARRGSPVLPCARYDNDIIIIIIIIIIILFSPSVTMRCSLRYAMNWLNYVKFSSFNIRKDSWTPHPEIRIPAVMRAIHSKIPR